MPVGAAVLSILKERLLHSIVNHGQPVLSGSGALTKVIGLRFKLTPWITDSVLPIVEANQAQIVKSDFAFDDLLHFIPTPGHTIDHYSVLVGRSGHDALITGDMIHSPIQGRYPGLGMRADYDSSQAGKTRRKIFDRFCDSSTLMCVTHFPMPSMGRVRSWGDGYKFVS